MQKIKPYIYYIALGGGILGAILRFWVLSAGTDSRGLYDAAHPGWIGYLALSSAMAVFLLIVCHREGDPTISKVHLLSPFAQVLAATGIGLYSLVALQKDGTPALLVNILGLCTVVALLLPLFLKEPNTKGMRLFLPCLYFLAQAFLISMENRGEPELLRFLPSFLACIGAALGAYQLWGGNIRLKTENQQCFWRALGGYLCLSAVPGGNMVYAAVGLWLLIG